MENDPRAIAIDVPCRRVFVVMASSADPVRGCPPTGYGKVSVLEARTGKVRQVIPVGVAPTTVMVDEQTGRAFILTSGSLISRGMADGWSWLPGWLRTRLPFIPATPLSSSQQQVRASITALDTSRSVTPTSSGTRAATGPLPLMRFRCRLRRAPAMRYPMPSGTAIAWTA